MTAAAALVALLCLVESVHHHAGAPPSRVG